MLVITYFIRKLSNTDVRGIPVVIVVVVTIAIRMIGFHSQRLIFLKKKMRKKNDEEKNLSI